MTDNRDPFAPTAEQRAQIAGIEHSRRVMSDRENLLRMLLAVLATNHFKTFDDGDEFLLRHIAGNLWVQETLKKPDGEAQVRALISEVRNAKVKTNAETAAEARGPLLRKFDSEALMAPIQPWKYLIPGMVPAAGYTLIAGALSAAKTTLMHTLLLSRATGYDLLGLFGTAGIAEGPCVLVSYEDNDALIAWRFQHLVQHYHVQLGRRFGPAASSTFLARIEANLRRVTLTGEAASGIVARYEREIVPNEYLIQQLLKEVEGFACHKMLIGLDPLRLAIVGSQNDDDGADTVVHVLNRIASALPESALLVNSHTTKSQAREGGEGMAEAAYATSGSALYSQHARSNLHLARMKPEMMRSEFAVDVFTEEEISKQWATTLTHGRLSQGAEGDQRHFAMRGGVLVPVCRARATTFAERARQFLPVVDAAIERMRAEGTTTISRRTLGTDAAVKAVLKRDPLRDFIDAAIEQGWMAETGETTTKQLTVTDTGRVHVASGPQRF